MLVIPMSSCCAWPHTAARTSTVFGSQLVSLLQWPLVIGCLAAPFAAQGRNFHLQRPPLCGALLQQMSGLLTLPPHKDM